MMLSYLGDPAFGYLCLAIVYLPYLSRGAPFLQFLTCWTRGLRLHPMNLGR